MLCKILPRKSHSREKEKSFPVLDSSQVGLPCGFFLFLLFFKTFKCEGWQCDGNGLSSSAYDRNIHLPVQSRLSEETTSVCGLLKGKSKCQRCSSGVLFILSMLVDLNAETSPLPALMCKAISCCPVQFHGTCCQHRERDRLYRPACLCSGVLILWGCWPVQIPLTSW